MATMALQTRSTELMFGEAQEIEIFAKRIKTMMRGGDKLKNEEALALAQVATITRLNPFIGECWYIPGSGPMIGIAGARRVDQENAAARGGYSTVEVIPCDPQEAGALESEVKGVAAAFRAEITDSAAALEYQKMFVSMLQALREAGDKDPVPTAREICGPRPKWVGYGFSKIGESTRMSKVQAARKRAEADALKKKIVIPFGAEMAEQDIAPDYIEAQATDPEPKRSHSQNMAELGFSDAEKNHDIGLGNLDADYPPAESKVLPRTIPYDDAKQVLVKVPNKGGGVKEVFVGQMSKEQLDYVIAHSILPASVEAAKIVLAHDLQMEPVTEGETAPQDHLL